MLTSLRRQAIFLIKQLFRMIKKSRQKLKYLEKEKSFYDEIKSIFHLFSRTFIEANKEKIFRRERVRL